MYPVIADPPFDTGAVHDTVAGPFPAAAFPPIVGAPGTVSGGERRDAHQRVAHRRLAGRPWRSPRSRSRPPGAAGHRRRRRPRQPSSRQGGRRTPWTGLGSREQLVIGRAGHGSPRDRDVVAVTPGSPRSAGARRREQRWNADDLAGELRVAARLLDERDLLDELERREDPDGRHEHVVRGSVSPGASSAMLRVSSSRGW